MDTSYRFIFRHDNLSAVKWRYRKNKEKDKFVLTLIPKITRA